MKMISTTEARPVVDFSSSRARAARSRAPWTVGQVLAALILISLAAWAGLFLAVRFALSLIN
jgi:hypothetical protein